MPKPWSGWVRRRPLIRKVCQRADGLSVTERATAASGCSEFGSGEGRGGGTRIQEQPPPRFGVAWEHAERRPLERDPIRLNQSDR